MWDSVQKEIWQASENNLEAKNAWAKDRIPNMYK